MMLGLGRLKANRLLQLANGVARLATKLKAAAAQGETPPAGPGVAEDERLEQRERLVEPVESTRLEGHISRTEERTHPRRLRTL